MCDNGLLFANGNVNMAAATDGLSNTMIVSDQSGLTMGLNRTSNYYGGWFGSRHPRAVADSTCSDLWQTGTTCVRFAPNAQIIQVGATDGMYRNNTILSSEHPGGVPVAIGDGSVRFVPETIDFMVLKGLACRYDGVPSEMP